MTHPAIPIFATPETIGGLPYLVRCWAEDETDLPGYTNDDEVQTTTNAGNGGSGKALKQDTAANRPYWKAAVPELGNRPAFYTWDGTDHRFFETTDTTGFHTSGGSISVVSVFAMSPLHATGLPTGINKWAITIGNNNRFYPYYRISATNSHNCLIQTGSTLSHTRSTSLNSSIVVWSRYNTNTGELKFRINGTEVTSTTVTGDLGAAELFWPAYNATTGIRAYSPFLGVIDGWESDSVVLQVETALAAYYAIELSNTNPQFWGYKNPNKLPPAEKFKLSINYDASDATAGATMSLPNSGKGSDFTDIASFDLKMSTAGKQPAIETKRNRAALNYDGSNDALSTSSTYGGLDGAASDLLISGDKLSIYGLFERRFAVSDGIAELILSVGDTSVRVGLLLQASDSALQLRTGGAGIASENSGVKWIAIPTAVVGAYDGAGNWEWYVNGTAQTDTTGDADSPVGLIGLGSNGNGTSLYFDGWIYGAGLAAGVQWTTAEMKELNALLLGYLGITELPNIEAELHSMHYGELVDFDY